ncbi:NEL-type E3 ubiquitin ligase domain-containing protein [Providencia burhodogranariea]|nr:NEL-type E3 ubiquitin ligase domain-containing protein [Providencia burhodogranariea]
MPKYHDTWLKWQNEALITCPDEFEDRKIALKKLCACLYDKTLHLNFYGLEITSLPLLPPYITKLDISYTHLKKLPELPSTLKVLYCNYAKLESLPELSEKLEELYCDDNKLVNLPKLPPKLKALSCDNNRLVRLPELPSTLNGLSCENTCLESLPNLPIGLISLYCDLNYLKDLPALPAGMKAISCADNELDFLPALPLSLEELTCNNNNLTRLPPLPLSLNHLIASNNSLTELPEIPASVTHIDCQDNELTHLPESVYRLTRGLINVAYNPLSEQTCENLQAMTFLPEYRGLQIYFSMASQYNFEPTIRALTDSVIDWFPVERKLEIKSKYSAIANERNAEPFSAFIDRLQDTSSAKKDPMFKQQVAQWLNRLADSPKLRESSFIIADGATESCEDRVALMWNDLQKVEFIHNIEDGQYDDKLPQFVANAREMFRLDQLEQISRENVNTLHDVDDIEVYLGYQTQLCIPLELASTGKEMYFFDVSGITSSDLNVAELRVKTAENHQFPEWFAQWSPWQKLIERTEPALWEKAYDKKIDIYENEYQNRINAELNDCELMGDVDAERALGIKVMHDIDKTIFIPLTWEALANKKQESLLNKKWNI